MGTLVLICLTCENQKKSNAVSEKEELKIWTKREDNDLKPKEEIMVSNIWKTISPKGKGEGFEINSIIRN